MIQTHPVRESRTCPCMALICTNRCPLTASHVTAIAEAPTASAATIATSGNVGVRMVMHGQCAADVGKLSVATRLFRNEHRSTTETLPGGHFGCTISFGATLEDEMSKAKLDGENRAKEYLSGVGLRVERFSKAEKKQGRRTPDFRVFSGDELAFYVEVKTAQEQDEWLSGSRNDSTYDRIVRQVHCAMGQFDSANPVMDHPNVLAIVNGDDEVGFTDMIQALTGDAYCESGAVISIFRGYSEGLIREEKLRVHLYLWFDYWKPGDPKKFFPEVHAVHHAGLCRHLSVDTAAMRRLPA